MTDDRPNPRPRPRPAPSAVDPAVPPAAEEPTPAPRTRRGAQPTVQLNTRVHPDIDELVAEACAERGMSKREAVEFALKKTFSKEYNALMARKAASKQAS